MRDLNRSSTLTVRRSAGPALTASRNGTGTGSTAPAHKPAEQPAAPASNERVVRSDALLQGRNYVNIVHNGETYQLRATRLGKLILTK